MVARLAKHVKEAAAITQNKLNWYQALLRFT